MNVVIVGGGKENSATLQILAEAVSIKILGILTEPDDEETIAIADAFDIPTTSDCERLLKNKDIDLIIDLSGSGDVDNKINTLKSPDIQVVDESTADLICRLLQDEGRKTYDLIDELTREHWSLYEIGIALSSARDLSETSKTIVREATKLTNTPAGSLAIYDEDRGEMFFAASVGFKHEMATSKSWKMRELGITKYVLNYKGPLILTNIDDYPALNNEQLKQEGVKSLIAAPLLHNDKVVGIIYVDDFKVRKFTEREISVLSLMSTYAALAIEKAQLLEKTKMLAVTDELTGLYNHRYLVQQLHIELSRAGRHQEPLSFIIIDIDHFKHYNDTNGHVKGNEILRQLASILQEESRISDIVARYGGEEFTIICPNTDKKSAYGLADRLRIKIEEHDFPDAATQPLGRLTISAGVSSYPEDTTDLVRLIEKADMALYMAKRNGRNCVFVYREFEDRAL